MPGKRQLAGVAVACSCRSQGSPAQGLAAVLLFARLIANSCRRAGKYLGCPCQPQRMTGERQVAARKEAAAKVAANRSAIINDLLKNSGIVRSRTNQYGTTLRVRVIIGFRV